MCRSAIVIYYITYNFFKWSQPYGKNAYIDESTRNVMFLFISHYRIQQSMQKKVTNH